MRRIRAGGARRNGAGRDRDGSADPGGARGRGAFVAITPHPSLAKLRMESKILPHSYQWRRGPFNDPVDVQTATIRVRARAAGWNASADITVPVTPHDVRLSLEPGLADRRGLPR